MLAAVLFVDDSPVARAAATRLLRDRGLDVTALGSTEEARRVDARGFAAALLDIDLGDGLGTEVAEALRAQAPSLPIAFLTGSPEGRAGDVASRLGPVFSKTGGVEDAVRWIASSVSAQRL